MILWKDIVGIGWNNDYALLNQTGSNTLKTTYINTLNGNQSVKYYKFVENEICTSRIVIPMNIAVANQTEYSIWPKSGSAHIQFSAVGKKTNSKLDFRYGHKTLSLGLPSISYPWGIGFNFVNVNAQYTPSGGVLNVTSPTVVK